MQTALDFQWPSQLTLGGITYHHTSTTPDFVGYESREVGDQGYPLRCAAWARDSKEILFTSLEGDFMECSWANMHQFLSENPINTRGRRWWSYASGRLF